MKKVNNVKKLRPYAILVIALLFIEITSIYFLKIIFLSNLRDSQTAVAQSAADVFMYDDNNSLSSYEAILSFAANNIDAQCKNGKTEAEIIEWTKVYFSALDRMYGKDTAYPSIIFNDKIYSGTGIVSVMDSEHEKTAYYGITEGKDGVVFTDVYIEEETNIPVITAAKKCSCANAIVAINIDVNRFSLNSTSHLISENSTLYLCDSKGTLISMWGEDGPENIKKGQEFINFVFDDIKSGKYNDNSCVSDYMAEHIGIYYSEIPNGWYSIVTTPHKQVVDNQRILAIAFTACIVVIIFIAYRDFRMSMKMDRTTDTLKVLSNLYFAIYRIDFKNEQYEIIKGSDYVSSQLEKNGDYDLLMKTALEVISENAREEFKASFSCENIRMLVENDIKNFGGDFKRRFGDAERWVNIRMMYDEEIMPDEAILVFKEIEREKQRSLNEIKLLETSLENAKHSEKTRQDFFKNMSHDMRTPLNAIIGLTALAEQNINDTEKVKEYLGNVGKSGQTLLNLVNEILDVSLIQDGTLRLNYERINIRECISNCVAQFIGKAQPEGKDFKAVYNIKNEIILGDNLRISQIVNNLLSNAFKFTNSGDSVSITLSQVERENFSQYIIEVSDTGIGMSEEFLLKLFNPYARETMFSADNIEGTGLGMPITRNIVTHMSGEIAVESKVNVGTTFTVTLPFTVINDSEIQSVAKEDSVSLEGRHFLLVEDNILNMEVAEEILKMNGAEVTEAWNGVEAVEKFKSKDAYTFDAILMDMQMPVMDGCEAARKIRSLGTPDAESVPIIAVTANAFPEDIAASTAAGMNAHISKPIDIGALCQLLGKLVK